MAIVVKRTAKVRSAKRPAKVDSEGPKDATSGIEVRLSNRDRDTLLAALNTPQPNQALVVAAEKYKQQCA